MSVLDHEDRLTRGATLLRQPIVHPDRSVFGYAVRAEVHDTDGTLSPEDLVEDQRRRRPTPRSTRRRSPVTGP